MQAPTSDQNHNPSPFFFSGATLMEDIERLSKSLTNIQHVSFEARLQQQVREFQEMVRSERESRSDSKISRQSCGRLQDMAEQGHAGAQYQIYCHLTLSVYQDAKVDFAPNNDPQEHEVELAEGDIPWNENTYASCDDCGASGALGSFAKPLEAIKDNIQKKRESERSHLRLVSRD